jgi:hypothetical protein
MCVHVFCVSLRMADYPSREQHPVLTSASGNGSIRVESKRVSLWS